MATLYEMQVRIEVKDANGNPAREFRSVKPSSSNTPYRYATQEEAWRMLRMCYGDACAREDLRVVPAIQ